MNQVLSRIALLICLGSGIAGCTAMPEAIQSRGRDSEMSEAYGDYRNDLAQSNIEREKAGQAPIPILDRAEWVRREGAKTSAAGEQ